MERLRVMIVDDEDEFSSTLAERLALRGIDASTAATGGAALQLVRARRPHVVLLDVKLPGIDGISVCRELLRQDPGLPVVLLTGHGSQRDAEEGTRLGAFAYLMKPVDIESLIAVLERAAGRPESEVR